MQATERHASCARHASRPSTYRRPPRTPPSPPLTQVFQSDGSVPAAPAAAGKKAAPAKKKPAAAETSAGGITPQSVALPGG